MAYLMIVDCLRVIWRRGVSLGRGHSALSMVWVGAIVLHAGLLSVALALRINSLNPAQQALLIRVLHVLPSLLIFILMCIIVRTSKLIDCINCEVYWIPFRILFSSAVAFILSLLDYWVGGDFAYIAQIHALWILSVGYTAFCLSALAIYMKANNCRYKVSASYWPRPKACRVDIPAIFPIVKMLGCAVVADSASTVCDRLDIAGPDVGCGDGSCGVELHARPPKACPPKPSKPCPPKPGKPLNDCAPCKKKWRMGQDDFSLDTARAIAKMLSAQCLPWSGSRQDFARLHDLIVANCEGEIKNELLTLRLLRFCAHLIRIAREHGCACNRNATLRDEWVRAAYDNRDVALSSDCESNIGRVPRCDSSTGFTAEEIIVVLEDALSADGVDDPTGAAEALITGNRWSRIHASVKGALPGITIGQVKAALCD
jgi:hypothetical protein